MLANTARQLLMVAFLSLVAFAQDTSNPVNVGLPLNATFSGSDLESVQVNNGNLHLVLPLWSSKGRGGLDIAYQFVYDNKGWTYDQYCYPQGYCDAMIRPEVGHTMNMPIRGPFDYYFTRKRTSDQCTAGSTTVGLQLRNGYILREPDATKHHFVPDPAAASANNCWPTDASLYSDDGSGWLGTVDKYGHTVSVAIQDLQQPFGTLPPPPVPATQITDRNGNYIQNGSPNGIDSLGRSFPTSGLQYFDPSGNAQNILVTYQNINIDTTPLCSDLTGFRVCTPYKATWSMPHTVTFPNSQSGLTYTFTFANNSYGELTSVQLPSGGQISYTYVDGIQQSGVLDKIDALGGRRVQSRTITHDGLTPEAWRYAYNKTVSPGLTLQVATVTDPIGNDTRHSLINGTVTSKVEYFSGSTSSGQLLKEEDTDNWTGNDEMPSLPKRVTTKTYDGSNVYTPAVETDYDSMYVALSTGHAYGEDFSFTRRNVIEKREYANNTLVRRTHYKYLHETNSNYQKIASLPTDVSVYDCTTSTCTCTAPQCSLTAPAVAYSYGSWSGGTLVSETQYVYDELPFSSPSPVATNHNDTSYGTGYTIRGNPTTVKKCSAISNNVCTAWSVTTNVYDILGNLRSSTDPGNINGTRHTTTFDYTDNWQGSSGTCVPTGSTYAFLKSTTNPANQSTSSTHYCTGEVNTYFDLNNQQEWHVFDALKRPTLVSYADGGATTLTYTDTAGAMSVARNVKLDSTRTIKNEAFYDGLGRAIRTKLTDPSDGDTFVDTTYDSLGRVATVSNPHRAGKSSTDGTTSYQYDALGRKILEIPPDGSITSNNVSTSYGVQTSAPVGLTTTVTDQAGHKRMTVTDGLGRLVQVSEPDPSSGSLVNVTWYTYDVLNNLTCLEQHGNVSGTGCSASNTNDGTSAWRIRRFVYDPLSRLTKSVNPESGVTTWTYDPDSNVLAKTDARGITINYNPSDSPIDVLHRVTKKTYSNGDAPVSYHYDEPNAYSYPIGHLTSMTDQTGTTIWGYDNLGRTSTKDQTFNIAGVTSSPVERFVAYSYNLDGSIGSIGYPSGAYVNYAYNTAGHPVSATSPSYNWVTNATYAPPGEIATYTNGTTSSFTGIFTTNTWNSRLQPSTFSAATQGTGGHTVMSLSFSFNQGTVSAPINNGLLVKINNNLQTGRNTNYKYDQLNRIVAAWHDATDWGTKYTVDAWGNLTVKGSCDGIVCPAHTSSESLSTTANQYNYLVGYPYDAVGNMTNDLLGHTYTYDAENRPYAAGGVSYYYDGLGNRVAKSNGKLYFFGIDSTPLTELNGSGALQAEYIYFGGKRVAMRKLNLIAYYYFSDQIGSANIVTNATASSTVQDIEFHPYGEEKVYTDTLGQEYRFTGKEHDPEAGNDYFGARYYSSTLGRFLTPDWAATPVPVPYANPAIPQTLNLYQYVNNNPSNKVDADGHCAEDFCIVEGGAAVYVAGAALVAGTAAVLSTPAGQRSLSTFTSAASASVSSTIHSITSFFSKSKDSTPAPAAPTTGAKPGDATAPAPAVPGTQTKPRSNPMTGEPGSTSQTAQPDGTPKQVRRYGPDGHPETDVDHGHDHGQGDPHAHDWGRPQDGTPPTHVDRGPGRPVKPEDPKPQ
jgi:RHS repeat-associated protein